MLPRLLNLLSPSYLLSRMSAPTYPSGSGKTLKITKARKRRVEEVMSLLDEAEERGCDGVWAFRGKMRMASHPTSSHHQPYPHPMRADRPSSRPRESSRTCRRRLTRTRSVFLTSELCEVERELTR